MGTISDGCRLCLDPFAENFITIKSPQLKEQMEKVFSFVIESKPGCSTSVCQSCWYTISEFYKYSEKVRQNQELLNGDTTTIEPPTDDCKVPFETIKVEPTIPSDCDLDDSTVVSAELMLKTELPNKTPDPTVSDDDDSYKSPRRRNPSTGKRRGRPRKRKAEDSESETEKPKKPEKAPARPQEEIDKEDQLLNEHFRMVCELCSATAPNFNLLHSHFRRIHKRRIGYVVCCNKKLFKRRSLLEHITFHADPDAFRCKVCNKKYKNKDTLDMHMLDMHSNEDQRPFKCDHCPQSFARKNALVLHMESHQKFECSQCDKLLSSKQALKTHVVNMHSDKDRSMVCDTCGQEFRSKQCFERHVNEHMGIVQRFQCGICQRWLKGERNFQNHINFIHDQKGQVFKCDVCQQDYPNLRALQSHKRAVHAEAKYECEFCGKKFRKAVALKEHRTTHTGEVLYSCEVCGVAKNSKANLYAHVKQRHPVEYAEKKLRAEQSNAPQA
ncbi:transcription factor grauzone-like [Ochlerotatus camptorhynchus]|uniref:transcription factor grauzone-like n=1 Tax=Ochlerotatus camptorhynchus TaxID=644619 RepID=UPI0031D4681B